MASTTNVNHCSLQRDFAAMNLGDTNLKKFVENDPVYLSIAQSKKPNDQKLTARINAYLGMSLDAVQAGYQEVMKVFKARDEMQNAVSLPDGISNVIYNYMTDDAVAIRDEYGFRGIDYFYCGLTWRIKALCLKGICSEDSGAKDDHLRRLLAMLREFICAHDHTHLFQCVYELESLRCKQTPDSSYANCLYQVVDEVLEKYPVPFFETTVAILVTSPRHILVPDTIYYCEKFIGYKIRALSAQGEIVGVGDQVTRIIQLVPHLVQCYEMEEDRERAIQWWKEQSKGDGELHFNLQELCAYFPAPKPQAKSQLDVKSPDHKTAKT